MTLYLVYEGVERDDGPADQEFSGYMYQDPNKAKFHASAVWLGDVREVVVTEKLPDWVVESSDLER